MADKRTEFNLGETQKTSVKVHHNPGGQSNWSLGWGEDEKPKKPSTQINYDQFKSIITKAALFWGERMKKTTRKMRRKDQSRRRKKKNN